MHVWLLARLVLNTVVNDLVDLIIGDFGCIGTEALPAYDRFHDQVGLIDNIGGSRIDYLT